VLKITTQVPISVLDITLQPPLGSLRWRIEKIHLPGASTTFINLSA